VYHSIFGNKSNMLQISLLRCCRSELSQLKVLCMMTFHKRSVSHLSRKCPIGLPIWNSLPFLIANVVSGNESVRNGSYVTQRNSPLGLNLLYGDHVPSNALNDNCRHSHLNYGQIFQITTSDHPLLLSLPSAPLPSSMRVISDHTATGPCIHPRRRYVRSNEETRKRGERWFRCDARGERWGKACFFWFGWFGCEWFEWRNVDMGRGVERLKKLCAMLDKNGNARLGWWTRKLFDPSRRHRIPRESRRHSHNTLIPIIHHTPKHLHIHLRTLDVCAHFPSRRRRSRYDVCGHFRPHTEQLATAERRRHRYLPML
jgi:hypothetical protein